MPHPSPIALSPFSYGRLSLPNRVAFLATVNNLGRNREITPELVAFYEERARGGAGLIVTEGLSVHSTSIPNGTVPLAFDKTLVPGFAAIADAVHAHGRPILGQLWHVGRQALWNPGLQPWAPSPGRDPYSGSTPHAMSESEIVEVIEGFAQSARNLADAGFDGVEIHGAHGYLVTQFLSPWSNHRDDAWGGSTAGRSRFVTEIIRRIRARCPDEFVVGLKMTAHEYVDGGIDLGEAEAIVSHLVDQAPPDYLGVSQANFSPSLEYHVPDLTFSDVPFAELAAGVRRVAGGTPVMAMAKVPDIETAAHLIDRGVADLVGMARAWLSDPHLVRRVEGGQRPRPCTYCNTCWHYIHTGRPVTCIYAPETGRELEARREASDAAVSGRQRVRVIGAGLAGLEVARVASQRGDEVHVYERAGQVGGRLAWEAGVPGRERMGVAVRWLEEAAVDAGAQLHRGRHVDEETVRRWPDTDRIVVAVGAAPVVEPLEGADDTRSLAGAWESRATLRDPVVIIDEIEDEPAYAVAIALAGEGHQVACLTRRDALARNVPYVSRIGVLRRLDEAGVTQRTQLVPARVEDGVLVARHVFSGRERPVGPAGTVVRAGPYDAADPPVSPEDHPVVGDASAPRPYEAVFREAHRIAARLDRLRP